VKNDVLPKVKKFYKKNPEGGRKRKENKNKNEKNTFDGSNETGEIFKRLGECNVVGGGWGKRLMVLYCLVKAG